METCPRRSRLGWGFAVAVHLVVAVDAFGAFEWQEDFDQQGISERWFFGGSGGGIVEIAESAGADGSDALALDMPAIAGKQAYALCLQDLPQPGISNVCIAFDMKIEGGEYGWLNGLVFGLPGYSVHAGRFAGAGGDAVQGNIFLDDQKEEINQPLNVWLHYELELTTTNRALRVWEQSEGGYQTTPLVELCSTGELHAVGNELTIVNGTPDQIDTYAQDRGLILIDNLELSGMHGSSFSDQDVVEKSSGTTHFEIGREDGRLIRLRYDQTEVLVPGSDEYILRLRDKVVFASETYDVVEEPIEELGGKTVFTCRNPAIPQIEIVKEYQMEGTRLAKRVVFSSDDEIDGFLYLRSGMALDPGFRQNGEYGTFRSWDLRSLTAANDIFRSTEMGHRSADVANQLVSLTSPAAGLTIGHYVYKLDDHYVWPSYRVSPEALVYDRKGWSFPAFCFHPETNNVRSITTHIDLVPGSQLELHRRIQNLPEVAAELERQGPEWVRKTKIEAVCWGQSPESYVADLQSALDASRYSEDEYGVLTTWGWATWGHIPLESNETVRIQGADIPVPEYAETTRSFRQSFPNVRYGHYHFQTSMATNEPYALAHQDWWAYGPDGDFVPQDEPGWTAVRRLMTAPGSIDTMLDELHQEMELYDCDQVYLDGGSRGAIQTCWNRMQTDQPYDYHDLWTRLGQTQQQMDPPRAVFMNNPINLRSDLAYMEISEIRGVIDDDWRSLANSLFLAKVYQRPSRYVGLLYRKGHDGICEPEFTNVLLALGLRPTGAADTNVFTQWPYLFGYLPFINASFELRDTYLVDALVWPQFWVSSHESPFQAQVLRQGNSALLTVANHDQEDHAGNIEMDFAAAGLDPERPVYCWYHEVEQADYSHTLESATAPIDRVVDTWFLDTRTGTQQVFEVSVPQKTLHMISCSHAPAVVTAINGQATQFQLADILDVHITPVEISSGVFTVEVDNPYEQATIALHVPDDWLAEKIRIEGAPATLQSMLPERDEYRMLFDVGAGRSVLSISEGCGSNTTNTLNYVETFEPYFDGFEIPGTNGWSASTFSAAVVTANAGSIQALNAYSEGCGYPVDAARAKVLEVDGAVTNSFSMDGNQVVWVDQMVQAYRLGSVDTNLFDGAHAAFYFNTNGYPVVYHHDLNLSSNVWTEISQVAVPEGDWVRLTLKMDYNMTDTVNDVRYFQPRINGLPLTNALAWTTNDGTGVAGGSWFAMPGNADRLNNLVLAGGGAAVDDVVLTTNNPLARDVVVASAHGQVDPALGTHSYSYGDGVALSVTNDTVIQGINQFVCNGWNMSGHAPATGSGTEVSIGVLTNDLAIVWLWVTNNSLTAQGTPIWWLASHGLAEVDDLLDGDNDGMLSWQEWVCDTVPADSNSVLRVTDIQTDGSAAEVFWKGGVLATQVLERCTNLVSGSWVPVFTNEPPTSATNSFNDSAATSYAGYYRLKVRR